MPEPMVYCTCGRLLRESASSGSGWIHADGPQPHPAEPRKSEVRALGEYRRRRIADADRRSRR